MIKLSPKQVEALKHCASDTRPAIEIAKELDVSRNTVMRWQKKFPADGAGGVRKPAKHARLDPTQKLLGKLVRIQLDTNPEFLAKCLKLLDLNAIANAR